MVSALLFLVLKKERAEISIVIGIVGSLLIFTYALAQISVVANFIKLVLGQLPIDNFYIVSLFKMLGITYIAEFASSICKDAGCSSIAGGVELFAKLSILSLSIPVLNYVLKIVEQFL